MRGLFGQGVRRRRLGEEKARGRTKLGLPEAREAERERERERDREREKRETPQSEVLSLELGASGEERRKVSKRKLANAAETALLSRHCQYWSGLEDLAQLSEARRSLVNF